MFMFIIYRKIDSARGSWSRSKYCYLVVAASLIDLTPWPQEDMMEKVLKTGTLTALIVVGMLLILPSLSLAVVNDDTDVGTNVQDLNSVSVKWLGAPDTISEARDSIVKVAPNVVIINENELGTVVPDHDILFIDQGGLTTLQIATVAAGLKDIIALGTPVILINNSEYILKDAANQIPRKTNDDRVSVLSDNRSAEGNHISQLYGINCTIYGLRYFPSTGGTSTYSGGCQGLLIDDGQMLSAYSWALGKISDSSETVSGSEPISTKGMGLLLTSHWQHDTDFTYNEPADLTHGYMNIVTNYYYLVDDGDSTYNYYFVRYGLQNIPGQTGEYGWRNADMNINTQNLAALGQYYPTRWLIDHSPATQTSGSTISVGLDSIGPTVGWSFPLIPGGIYNQCDLGVPRAQWWYNVDENNLQISQSNYIIYPGIEVKTQQDYGGYYHVNYDQYSIQWFHYNGLWWETYSWSHVLSGNVTPL